MDAFFRMVKHIIFDLILFIIGYIDITFGSVEKLLIENNDDRLIIELNVNAITDSDLFKTTFLVGLPNDKIPKTNIEYSNKTEILFETRIENKLGFNWINQQRLKNLSTATLAVSPLADQHHYYKNIRIIIEFDEVNLHQIQ